MVQKIKVYLSKNLVVVEIKRTVVKDIIIVEKILVIVIVENAVFMAEAIVILQRAREEVHIESLINLVMVSFPPDKMVQNVQQVNNEIEVMNLIVWVMEVEHSVVKSNSIMVDLMVIIDDYAVDSMDPIIVVDKLLATENIMVVNRDAVIMQVNDFTMVYNVSIV